MSLLHGDAIPQTCTVVKLTYTILCFSQSVQIELVSWDGNFLRIAKSLQTLDTCISGPPRPQEVYRSER